jgi:hypothetical protein
MRVPSQLRAERREPSAIRFKSTRRAQFVVVERLFLRYSVGRSRNEMKNLIVLALVAVALYYGPQSCSAPAVRLTPEQAPFVSTKSGGASAARQWQQAPQAVTDMQDAIGNGGASSAHAARDAVQSQLR